MTPDWPHLIAQIHAAPQQIVLAVTGGGASAIADLLAVPGGSRTVLEATVPYSAAALADWLGRAPDQFCSEDTALAMAAVAYQRAQRLAQAEGASAETQIGVACTAALVSDRPKRGEHRCYVALQSSHATVSVSLVLTKGARDRLAEEALVGRLILSELAKLCGIADLPPLALLSGETVHTERYDAPPILVDLLHSRVPLAWSLPDGSFVEQLAAPPRAVLCGSFAPLHEGHRDMRAAAERVLQTPVAYELSVHNVDKAPLDYLTIARRARQFTDQPLALTVAPRFATKSRLLPNTIFVVGVDTAQRIIHPRYYGDNPAAMESALAEIRSHGGRFLVAGRLIDERFTTLRDLPLPPAFADLFTELPEQEFRADISSTELRRQAK